MEKIYLNRAIMLLLLMISGSAFSSEVKSQQSFNDNLRFKIDLSSRVIDFSPANEVGYFHALGFDLHKVFSANNKDIGTLLLQGYLTRIDNFPNPPGIFDSGDDTEFIYRIFNFNYTGFSGNAPNIRVGHFEVAYGLEHMIDTNGTLRQYQQGRNLGIKADWGVSLNKQFTRFEYEIGATTGDNQRLGATEGTYVYSARLGSPRDENTVVGVSLYKSRLNNVDRERLGLDFQYYVGLHGIFAELSWGENNNQDILNSFLEWNYTNPSENQLYYVQLSSLTTGDNGSFDSDSALQTSVGVKFTPYNEWSFSAQYTRDLSVFGNAPHATVISVQARYRF